MSWEIKSKVKCTTALQQVAVVKKSLDFQFIGKKEKISQRTLSVTLCYC